MLWFYDLGLEWFASTEMTLTWSTSELMTIWCYTNVFIIIIIILAHQHKACRQLKIKQEMTGVGD